MSSNRHNDIAVQIQENSAWLEGRLDPDDWRRNGQRSEATVRWRREPAMNRMDTFDGSDMRRTDDVELEAPTDQRGRRAPSS